MIFTDSKIFNFFNNLPITFNYLKVSSCSNAFSFVSKKICQIAECLPPKNHAIYEKIQKRLDKVFFMCYN